jgi:hypothetical protein
MEILDACSVVDAASRLASRPRDPGFVTGAAVFWARPLRRDCRRRAGGVSRIFGAWPSWIKQGQSAARLLIDKSRAMGCSSR